MASTLLSSSTATISLAMHNFLESDSGNSLLLPGRSAVGCTVGCADTSSMERFLPSWGLCSVLRVGELEAAVIREAARGNATGLIDFV